MVNTSKYIKSKIERMKEKESDTREIAAENK